MTPEGAALAPEPDTSKTVVSGIRETLSGPQRQIFDCLLDHGRAMRREEVAEACGWDAGGGHIKNIVGSMRTLQVIEYPVAGEVAPVGCA